MNEAVDNLQETLIAFVMYFYYISRSHCLNKWPISQFCTSDKYSERIAFSLQRLCFEAGVRRTFFIIIIDYGITLKVSLTPGSEAQFIVAPVKVDCEGNATPTHRITAGSAKLPDWPIRETVKPSKIIGESHKKSNRKRRSHANGQLPHSLYSLHKNRKIEGRVKKRNQKISGEVDNLERMIDGTNKMRNMSKQHNQC